MSRSSSTPQEPTARDREVARAEGRTALSRQLVNAFVLGMATVLAWYQGPRLMWSLAELLRERLRAAGRPTDGSGLLQLTQNTSAQAASWMVPAFMTLAGVAVLIHWLQRGFIWNPDRISPDLGRLSRPQPQAWIDVVWRLLVSSMTTFVSAAAVIWILRQNAPTILLLSQTPARDLVNVAAPVLLQVAAAISVAALIMSATDYAFQWWRAETRLRESLEQSSRVNPMTSDLARRGR